MKFFSFSIDFLVENNDFKNLYRNSEFKLNEDLLSQVLAIKNYALSELIEQLHPESPWGRFRI